MALVGIMIKPNCGIMIKVSSYEIDSQLMINTKHVIISDRNDVNLNLRKILIDET